MLKHAGDRAQHTLTVEQVAHMLAEAGVPRSLRRIKYYCQSNALDGGYLPSPTGDQWYINPASVPGLIGDLKQFEEQARRRTQHAASDFDSLKRESKTDTDAAGSSMLKHAASASENIKELEDDGGVSQHAAAGLSESTMLRKYVDRLEGENEFLRKQVETKDDQLNELGSRFKETQALLGSVQRMLAPLLGQPDPFRASSPASEVVSEAVQTQG